MILFECDSHLQGSCSNAEPFSFQWILNPTDANEEGLCLHCASPPSGWDARLGGDGRLEGFGTRWCCAAGQVREDSYRNDSPETTGYWCYHERVVGWLELCVELAGIGTSPIEGHEVAAVGVLCRHCGAQNECEADGGDVFFHWKYDEVLRLNERPCLVWHDLSNNQSLLITISNWRNRASGCGTL